MSERMRAGNSPISAHDEWYVMTVKGRRNARASHRRARRKGQARAHLSVLFWAIRSRARWILLILITTVGLDVGLFGYRLSAMSMTSEAGILPKSFSVLLGDAGIPFFFLVAFAVMTGALVGYGTSGQSHTTYTLDRLKISEQAIRGWQAVFSGGCYLLLACVQILTVGGLWLWYRGTVGVAYPDEIGGQTLLLTFYGHDLLHGLLPLRDTARWVVSVLSMLTLSLATAHWDFATRYRRGWVSSILAVLFVMWAFTAPMGQTGRDLLISSPVMLALCAWILIQWKKGGREAT